MAVVRSALVNRLRRYDSVVEVGIGRRAEVALELADNDVNVTATDIVDHPVPEVVSFVIDDVTRPDRPLYETAEAVYALNLPTELHRPVYELAVDCETDLLFTTLGGEHPAIDVVPESLPGGETLYSPADPRFISHRR